MVKGTREMAQWLSALAALPDHPSSEFQYPHGGLYNKSVTPIPGDLITSFGFHWHQAHMWCIDIEASKGIHTHRIKIIVNSSFKNVLIFVGFAFSKLF